MMRSEVIRKGVDWRLVGLFLGATFGVSYLLDLVLYLRGGLSATGTLELLQLRMLVPGLVAILLGMFAVKGCPYHVSHAMPDGRRDRARGFFYIYLGMTLLFIAVAVIAMAAPDQVVLMAILKQVALLGGVFGLLLFRLIGGRESFARANLRGGRFVHWIIYGGAIVVFFGLQAVLNSAFHLSTPADLRTFMPGVTTVPVQLIAVIIGAQTIVVASLVGLVVAFGEEMGWRGFLQGQLVRMGKRRGILLLGVIWGAWHYPVIWMGYNYPGRPLIGTLMMTLFTVVLGFALSYAVLKTGSVLLAAFMHAIFNQCASFFLSMAYKTHDTLLSFGIGIYGLAILAAVVLVLLVDPIWREESIRSPNQAPGKVDSHSQAV